MNPRTHEGILATVGNTPLVKLERVSDRLGLDVHTKMERFNPGGSVKDRVAVSLLMDRIHSGELSEDRSVVVESSSGNLGVGLAQVCRYFRIPFICVVDPKTPEATLAILRAYGAKVDVVDRPAPESGEFLDARLNRVKELVGTLPGAFWPNQYANPHNPRAHEGTMSEIAAQLAGKVDYVFCTVSTIGTLRGCSSYARRQGLGTRFVAVDAFGSVLFSDEPAHYRLIPGFGASVRPALLDPGAADHIVHVDDLESVAGCRQLVSEEAILAGGSSGAAFAGLNKFADRITPGSTCVLLFPDSGERYIDTVYSDDWVREQFGDVFHMWKD